MCTRRVAMPGQRRLATDMAGSLRIFLVLLRACLALVALGLATSARAQAGVAIDWTQSQGRVFRHAVAPDLESGYALAQDSIGFVWLGTQSGLVRWDGQRAHDYAADLTAPASLPDSYVRALLVDRAGVLWVGTKSGGLAHYDPATDTFPALQDRSGIVGRDVSALAQRRSSGLWIASNHGLAWLDTAGGRLTSEPVPANVGTIQCVAEAHDGSLWLGSDRGLWVRRPGQPEFSALPLEPTPEARPISVLKLLEDSQGRVWVGTRLHGTYTLDAGAGAATPLRSPQDDDLAGDTVYALAESGSGEVWIGTYGAGVVRTDPASGRTLRYRHDAARPSSLLDDDVGALMLSRDGVVWIATAYGLSTHDPRFDGVMTLFGGRGRAIADANVPAVMVTSKGTVFLATGAQGLQILASPGGAPRLLVPDPRHPDASLPRARVIALAQGVNGTVWIGTQGGLYRCTDDGREIERVAIPGRSVTADVWTLLVDGASLWVGGSDGLWALDVSQPAHVGTQRHFDRELGQGQVRALALGPQGELWIGTNGRAFRLDRERTTLRELVVDPKDPQALPGGLVSGMLVDRRGSLWVATLGQGLQAQDGLLASGMPRFRRFTTRNGLPNNGVDALLSDASGRIWASTDDGVAQIDPSDMSIRVLNAAQGAGITTFWTGAASAAPDGSLLFGGEGGLLVVRPDRLPPLQPLGPPVATDANVGGVPMAAAQLSGSSELTVPASAPRVQVEFGSLAYGEQEALRYAYRLEGFDNDWNETTSRGRIATYTKLPPGRYKLALRVARPGGAWSATREIALRVQPRWFERTDVHVACAAALILSAWVLHLWRLRIVARRQAHLEEQVEQRTHELEQSRAQIRQLSIHNARSLEQERTRVSRELHDEMAQQMAALRMEVALLRRFSNPAAGAEDLPVQALLERVDNVIRSIRELVTQLRPPALDGGLPAAIEWLTSRFEKQTGIPCDLELADCAAFSEPDAATMAFRVIQESLTNVRRHANAASVHIRLKPAGQACRLEVIDDGQGFDPRAAHAGFGLLGMEERVTALDGEFSILSSPGRGTCVTVTLDNRPRTSL